MGDGEIVKLRVLQDARGAAGRAGAGRAERPVAAIAAHGLHGPIIGLDPGRAKPRIHRQTSDPDEDVALWRREAGYSKPQAAAVVPIDAQRLSRSPKHPSRHAPS